MISLHIKMLKLETLTHTLVEGYCAKQAPKTLTKKDLFKLTYWPTSSVVASCYFQCIIQFLLLSDYNVNERMFWVMAFSQNNQKRFSDRIIIWIDNDIKLVLRVTNKYTIFWVVCGLTSLNSHSKWHLVICRTDSIMIAMIDFGNNFPLHTLFWWMCCTNLDQATADDGNISEVV